MARAKSKPKNKKTESKQKFDVQGAGLLLLSIGILLLAVVSPFSIGGLGKKIQISLLTNLGVAAYFLPWPILLLGINMFLGHMPKRWFSKLSGYFIFALSIWLMTVLFNPVYSGIWGKYLRSQIGSAIILAFIPAVFLLTVGIDLVAAQK